MDLRKLWPFRRKGLPSPTNDVHWSIRKGSPHPKDAPGDFYVQHGECTACGAPEPVAPDLIRWDDDPARKYDHCYFRKQPENSQELEQALGAIAVSCCQAIRYRGKDTDIIRRIRAAGNSDALD